MDQGHERRSFRPGLKVKTFPGELSLIHSLAGEFYVTDSVAILVVLKLLSLDLIPSLHIHKLPPI